MSDSLAIITVVYKHYDILADFFSSLEKQTSQAFHIFLADVSENDRKDIPERKNLSVIITKNKGYAHGVNMGIDMANKKGYNQFAIVNSDIIFDSHFVEKTRTSLQSHPTSLIGGKIYYAPGYEYHKKRYTDTERGRVLWYAGGNVDWKHALTHHRGVDELDTGQYDTFEQTEFITGCFMAYDKTVFEKVGSWDESYFMYYEDADFCERAQQAGIALYYDPSLIIWHKNAQSSDGAGSDFHVRYQRKNRVRWALRYAPWRTKFHVLKNHIYQR